MKQFLLAGAFLLTAQSLLAQNSPFGIGTATPRTMLEIANNTTVGANAPFITLHNIGNGTYNNLDKFKVGGLLGSSYRDVRNPAYMSGMWFERIPIVNGLSSGGEIVFGTTDNPTNLQENFPNERMRITYTGKVGIGTSNPQELLEVRGNIRNQLSVYMYGDDITGFVGRAASISNIWNQTPEALAVNYFKRDFLIGGWDPAANWKGASIYITSANGNVLINKTSQTNTSYKLDVNGNIRANKITVNTTGADFVFDKNYALPTLQNVEQFIQQHHHLPAIPSAVEMQQEGLNVGDNQIKLLQKVEELTLYIIDINKQLQEQKAIIKAQQEQISRLENKK